MSDLEARDLTKSYGAGSTGVSVLERLNLAVGEGRLVGLVGPSGSGKSTLLHLLGGLDSPTSGNVFFDGVAIFDWGPAQLAEFRNRSIGFVFQFHHLLKEFTALENTSMPLLIRGVSADAAQAAARAALGRVGLAGRESHRPGELSGGEQQRVAIARALVGDPRILLADEPTGNLDQKTGAAVFEMIRELHRERGLTSVIATHNERMAASCDEIWDMAELRARTAQI